MDCKYPQPRSGKELKCFKPNKAGLCEGSFSFSLDGGGGGGEGGGSQFNPPPPKY